jgi:glycerophosphoryl diester phosphodiesterase
MRTVGSAALGLLLVTAAGGAAGRPLIAAHRGGALLWPENSLTAFRGALALGVDLVELDVHLTRDGEVVVIHDPTLERTTTGHGTVGARTWPELAGVTVRGTAGEGIPRLAEVLDLVRPSGVRLLLEIKAGPDRAPYPGIEAAVLRLLEERRLTTRTTVMAFDWRTLERLRALSPTLRLTGLLDRRGADAIGGVRTAAERLARLRVEDLGIERTLLTPEAVAAARAAGLTIGVWTVNAADQLRTALEAGVDYVTTDRPDLALELRGPR